jgi:hypothetical protein
MGLVFAVVGLGVRRVARPGAGAVALPIQAAAPPRAMTFAVPLAGLRREAGHWFVQARWADPRSGVQRVFESEPLPFDPVPQMRSMTSVQVAFDPSVPDGPYQMDLSFLREPDDDATIVARRG